MTKTLFALLTGILGSALYLYAADNASSFSMGLNRVHASDTTTHQIEIDSGTKLHFQNNADRVAFSTELGIAGGVTGVHSVNAMDGTVILGAGDVGAQPASSNLTLFANITPSTNVQTLLGATNYAAFKTSLSLNNVPNVDATNAGNISSGTLSNSRLNSNVMTMGGSLSNSSTTTFSGSLGIPTRIYFGDYSVLAVNTSLAQFELNPLAVVTQAAAPIPNYSVWVSGAGGVLAPVGNSTTGKFFGAHTGAAPAWNDVTDAVLVTADVTTNNADTTKHGFLKKLDNDATHFMDGTGAWSAPAGKTQSSRLTADTVNSSSTTHTVIWSFTTTASGNYHLVGTITGTGGTSGQGLKFCFHGVTFTSLKLTTYGTGSSGISTLTGDPNITAADTFTGTYCAGSSLTGIILVDCVVEGASAGTASIDFVSSSNGTSVTVKKNSSAEISKTN